MSSGSQCRKSFYRVTDLFMDMSNQGASWFVNEPEGVAAINEKETSDLWVYRVWVRCA